MHSSFSYNQMVRERDIRKYNIKLYEKCFMGRNRRTASDFNPEGATHNINNNESPNLNKSTDSLQQPNSKTNSSEKMNKDFLLRNHRNYPINKMTSYERARENQRLSNIIAAPSPALPPIPAPGVSSDKAMAQPPSRSPTLIPPMLPNSLRMNEISPSEVRVTRRDSGTTRPSSSP